ncbi:MAG: YceI family protein [Gammaproteobacteria bacterium]|nr:YceI family protein [Gammaproteobacteria bacterium]
MAARIRTRPAAAIVATLLAGAPAVAAAEPATFELDPEHTVVAFLVSHIGYAKVLGRFNEVEGSFVFDEEAGTLEAVEVVVETDSVTTDHGARDRHVRSDDFLASDDHPRMRFTADEARRTGDDTFEIDGQLELRGVTQPLTLRATLNQSGEYPIGDGAYVVGVSARGSLRRSDFGMTYALDDALVADEVELLIEIEARRQ